MIGALIASGCWVLVLAILALWGNHMARGLVQHEVGRRSQKAWRNGCPECGWKP